MGAISKSYISYRAELGDMLLLNINRDRIYYSKFSSAMTFDLERPLKIKFNVTDNLESYISQSSRVRPYVTITH